MFVWLTIILSQPFLLLTIIAFIYSLRYTVLTGYCSSRVLKKGILLIHSCRSVLKNLRTLTDGIDAVLSFLGNHPCICLWDNYDKTYDYSEYQDEIKSIINQLISDEFLAPGPVSSTFFLTQRRIHPYQFQLDAFRSFLFRSILVPIVVSFVTALLTLLVRSWL